MQFKLLWLKASAKSITVNMRIILGILFAFIKLHHAWTFYQMYFVFHRRRKVNGMWCDMSWANDRMLIFGWTISLRPLWIEQTGCSEHCRLTSVDDAHRVSHSIRHIRSQPCSQLLVHLLSLQHTNNSTSFTMVWCLYTTSLFKRFF